MKKDVIYIDIEDDITSIIQKVKQADARVVALVPPKRLGVLQSAVNLKLLQRAATSADKRAVLITSDQSLSALAAAAAMPVAKNLQSKPEVAQIDALEIDDEDIINGEDLPVGELAKTADVTDEPEVKTPLIATAGAAAASLDKPTSSKKAKAVGAGVGSKLRIPNFDTFRKKMLWGSGAALLLVALLIWGLVIAPRATIAITAETESVQIQKNLILDPTNSADIQLGRLKPAIKQIKKSTGVDFDATGKKEVGDKATGTVKLSQQSLNPTPVPAGTQLTTSGGLVFTTDSAVTVPASTFGGPGCFPTACAGTTTVAVTATAPGSSYNGASGSLSGAPGSVSASFTAPTGGGTDKTATVVSDGDIAKAKDQLQTQDNSATKTELVTQFVDKELIIQESFQVVPGNPSSTPAVGEQAIRARLNVETTYTMLGLNREEVKLLLDDRLNDEIDSDQSLRIYNNGADKIQFSNFVAGEGGVYGVNLATIGYIGPSIDEQQLAKDVAGKRSGEIREQVSKVQGVKNVDVKFLPFWVNKAPEAEKIRITFNVTSDAQ